METFIAVDFDGTIVEFDFPRVGPFAPGALEWLARFKEAGAKIILWTMRSDRQEHGGVLSDAVSACREAGLEFDFINENPQAWTTSPKAYAHIYIDDAAIGCPLLESSNGHSVVDWSVVGPAVMEKLSR